MFHYTDNAGFKAISSQVAWTFKASVPRGPHPLGAYFTQLNPETPKLAKKLRMPQWKMEWLFEFDGTAGLVPIDEGKGRGAYIFFSPADYIVEPVRQRFRDQPVSYQQGANE